MRAIFTPTVFRNNTPNTPITNHPTRLRHILLLALLALTSVGIKAADYVLAYVNGGTTYYLARNGTTGVQRVTDFDPTTCIWSCASNTAGTTAGTLNNGNTYGYLFQTVNGTRYFLNASANALGLGTNAAANNYYRWRTNGTYVYNRYSGTYSYYINLANGVARNTTANTASNARPYAVSSETIESEDHITTTINMSSYSGNTITFSHDDLSGTFVPQYTQYTFNNTTHNYYNGTDYGSADPTVNASSLTPSYTWSITGANASINSQSGVVTFNGTPSGNYTVTLTVSNISPLQNKTVTLNFSAQAVAQNTTYTYSPITVTPSSTTLDLGDEQTFQVSNTVTETSQTTPAHTKITVDDTDYYYYNGSLSTTAPTPTPGDDETLTLSSVGWSFSGTGAGYFYIPSTYYSPSTYGAPVSNEVTLTRNDNAKSDTDFSDTMTATANYGDKTMNLTATATINIPKTEVDISGISCQDLTINYGETGTLVHNAWYSGSGGALHVDISYSVADQTVATVSETGVVTALKVGTTRVTLQTKKMDGTNGPSCQAWITVTPAPLPAPTITINNSGVATLTDNSGISGATIRYTTDGTTPTASTATTVANGGTVQLTRGQTIMAIVTVAGGNYTPSAITTEMYVTNGTFGGIVYLDDREDHNWSYYQPASALPDGYPARMRSPYPRNVKITYYGYGDNTLSTSEVPSPASNTFNINTSSNDVKVGIGENENTFIYYKTLERDANNRFPYEMIPNPFYVRPKSGNIYTGFYKWRIKSIKNGAIYTASTGGTALSVGSMLDAETTYYFQPTDNTWTNANNATSMEIELEALWAPAEVSTGNTPSFSKGYNSVERNFYVGSGKLFSSTTPCTYSSFYPNGTTNGTTAATLNNRSSKETGTAKTDSKVEYMTLTGNTTNADAYNVTFGRGIGGSGGTFYPVNATKNVDINFRLRLESGTFGALYLMADGTSNRYQRFQNNFTFGSDYDRAKGDNSKLTVAQRNAIKNGNSEFSQANQDKPTLTCIIKSGEFQKDYWNNNNNAQYNYGFYCCQDHDNTSYPGLVSLTVEGGHFASIIGGRGNYTVGCITQDSLAFTLRFKGGLVDNSVYGASSNNATYGSRRLIFTGGEVRGWIAAGCNGTSDTDERGQTHGDSYVYVGGNTKVGNAEVPRTNNSAVGGNVFGAGRGGNRQYASIKNSHVAVADNAEVLHNVFGGGFHGHIVTASNLFILGGTTHGNVFGGGDNNSGDNRSIPTVNIHMTGGLVEGGVYGGSNENGIVTSLVNMHIDGGQVGTTSQTANIHGGGLGSNTRVNGNVELTLGTTTQTTPGVTVYGDVYGGSALGLVNGTAASDTYHTNVTLNKGTINGSLYGGGLGDNNTAANVYGPVQVNVYGGTVNKTSFAGSGGIYGANNVKGAPQRAVTVDIYGTDQPLSGYALDAVYGGGNQADYKYGNGYPKVTIHNCDNSIEYVYGGGNAAEVASTDVTIYGGDAIGYVFGGGNGTVRAANVTGNANLKIHGGTIHNVFGGSNSQGTIGGDINLTVESKAEADGQPCTILIDSLYGGGNKAASSPGNISIVCTGTDGYIDNVFGGANAANITGNIDLKINGGNIGNVFGGNNSSGSISGNIQVTVGNNPENCGQFQIKNVYGGGNLAAYNHSGTNYPAVSIMDGAISGNVFGGGYGASATVTANPQVTVSGGTIAGDVFGGGEAAGVTGNSSVKLTGGQAANVYGGGMQADVTGNTSVSIENGTVSTDVYGGGMQGDVSGNVTVNISKSGTPGTVIIGRDVYGGGALANTNTGNQNGGSFNTVVNLYPGATIGHDVYGGGRGQKAADGVQAVEAIVYGNVTVNQLGAVLIAAYSDEGLATGGRIFGGNNVNGTPKGHVLVYVEKTVGSSSHSRATDVDGTEVTYDYDLAAVYGGGNQAEYNPNGQNDFAEVQIEGCDDVSIHSVYGGGNAASTPATKVTIGGAYEIGYVFGGGNGAGTGNPGANVGYHAYPESISDANHISDRESYKYGTGVATTNVYGGRIHYIYGGSNTKGNVRETAVAMLDEINACPLVVDGIYGGGRSAYMEGKSILEMGCVTGLNEIYGGSEKADVGNDVELTLTSGHFGKVFGGNNKGGRIFGSIKVNIEQTGCVPITIDELYLGGNNAPYSVFGYTDNAHTVTIEGESVTHYDLNESGSRLYADPELNIRSFKSIGNVYGGGKGAPATIVGNPQIDINVTQGWVNGEYIGNVGEYTTYSHKPGQLPDGVIETVYGGGNAADVIGTPTIRIGDKMGQSVELKSMQSLHDNLPAGGETKNGITIEKPSSGSIKYTAADNNSNTITVGVSQTVKGATITGNVYGGGNQANVTGSTNIQVGPAQ